MRMAPLTYTITLNDLPASSATAPPVTAKNYLYYTMVFYPRCF